jgi:hypothetical protein
MQESIIQVISSAIRRRRPGQIDDSPGRRQPVVQVHVDQTTTSAIARVHRHLPVEDAPKLLEKRFQLINLWRPIENPAIDWPLGLCDYRSVESERDSFPMALIYPDREGEILGVQYNPKHNWKYLYGMTTDEIVLIKWYISLISLLCSGKILSNTTPFQLRFHPGWQRCALYTPYWIQRSYDS